MTRTEFTVLVSRLLTQMILDGLHPAIDYCKRSDHEQVYLFSQNDPAKHIWVTADDGVHHISDHQLGRAVDILLFNDVGEIVKNWTPNVANKYHSL